MYIMRMAGPVPDAYNTVKDVQGDSDYRALRVSFERFLIACLRLILLHCKASVLSVEGIVQWLWLAGVKCAIQDYSAHRQYFEPPMQYVANCLILLLEIRVIAKTDFDFKICAIVLYQRSQLKRQLVRNGAEQAVLS